MKMWFPDISLVCRLHCTGERSPSGIAMGLDLLMKAAKRSGTHLLNSSPPIETLV